MVRLRDRDAVVDRRRVRADVHAPQPHLVDVARAEGGLDLAPVRLGVARQRRLGLDRRGRGGVDLVQPGQRSPAERPRFRLPRRQVGGGRDRRLVGVLQAALDGSDLEVGAHALYVREDLGAVALVETPAASAPCVS
eukprot:1744287-Rhodomonas_salina.1